MVDHESVTVVIPSIPTRKELLKRAISSVLAQTHSVDALSIALDNHKDGAWVTRQRALDAVTTEWVAFLDDDDELLPHHVERCFQAQRESNADVIIPWYDVVGGEDPVPAHRGLQVSSLGMHSFGITCLVRMSKVRELGVRFISPSVTGIPEDYSFWVEMWKGGAAFCAIPDTTWLWHHHGLNTSGKPTAW